jgi:hypothetical protein
MLSIFMVAMAAMPAQLLRGFLERFFVPEISEMESSPGWTEGSTRRETKSPRPSTAHPRKSKPGPRLATVAGAKDLTEVKTGSGSVVVMMGREKLQRSMFGFLGLRLVVKEVVGVVGFKGERKQIAIFCCREKGGCFSGGQNTERVLDSRSYLFSKETTALR